MGVVKDRIAKEKLGSETNCYGMALKCSDMKGREPLRIALPCRGRAERGSG